jgi:hypothetical protein
MKLLWIINVGTDVTGQSLITFSAFVRYWRKSGNTMRVHQLFIDFNKTYDSVRWEVLYNILIEFGLPMKLVRLIEMCLNETYSEVRIGKHLSDSLLNQNGFLMFTTAFQLCFRICHRKVQENQVGLKFNGTHQILPYVDDVNPLGDNIDTIEKNTETLTELVRRLV